MENSAQVTPVLQQHLEGHKEEEFPLSVNLRMDPHTLYLLGSSYLVPLVQPQE